MSIQIVNVSKTYHMGAIEVTALAGVSLQIADGELVAIMGPSGSGKSTLMNILGCLDVPSTGSYRLDGEEVGRLKDDQLASVRSKKIGFVFQQFNLLARTPAVEQVELPMVYAGVRDRRARALAALDAVGLSDRAHHARHVDGEQEDGNDGSNDEAARGRGARVLPAAGAESHIRKHSRFREEPVRSPRARGVLPRRGYRQSAERLVRHPAHPGHAGHRRHD